MKYRAFLAFIIAFVIGSQLHVYSSEHRIALIHSYQEGYTAADGINKLFAKELKNNKLDFQLKIFYLDCEKYESKEEEHRMSLFVDSIQQWGGDMIAVLDDQATYSLMACSHPYVKQIPVVFSGVNYPNDTLLHRFPNITGYIDRPDYYNTCQMIERIMGKVRIHIMNSRTVLDKLIWKDLNEQCRGTDIILHKWRRKDLSQMERDNLTISDQDYPRYGSLHEKLNGFNQLDSTIIVRLSSDSVAARDLMWLSSGIFKYSLFLYTKRDYTTLRIGSLFDNPGFETINEGFGVKDYMLGGYFVPIETQIKEMAAGIRQRLDGKMPEQPVRQLEKAYMVNWNVMKKYQIPMESIPQEYTIVNLPLRERYETLYIWLKGLFGFALFAGIAYLFFIYSREKTRKKDAQRKLRFEHEALTLAIEGSNTYAWSLNGRTATFDQPFRDLIKSPELYMSVEEVAEYVHPDERASFMKNSSSMMKVGRKTALYRCNFGSEGYQ